MLTEKAVALLRSLQSRFASILSKIAERTAPAAAYPQPVVTVVDLPDSPSERGSVFIPSSKYAEYVLAVVSSDRRYPDTRYSSRV